MHMLRRQAHLVTAARAAAATRGTGAGGFARAGAPGSAARAARPRAGRATAAVVATLLGGLALAPAVPASGAPSWPLLVCHGSVRHPGVLAGRFGEVVVRGLCLVDRGPAVVERDVLVLRHSALLAAFGRGHSRLIVGHNIVVSRGATLFLGCGRSFRCLDDRPHGRTRLSSRPKVFGSIIAVGALGVVVHYAWIGGSVVQVAGGGGLTCRPMGIFAVKHSPAFSAYEDSWIGHVIIVRHLRSCWLGVIRNRIGIDATISSNVMASHDANEIVSNVAFRDLTCWRDSPRAQFGDSRGTPNRVGLHAYYQCGFHVILPNPAGQHVHFSHISVHLHR